MLDTTDFIIAHGQTTAWAMLYPQQGPWQQAINWWQHAASLAPPLPLVIVADLGSLLNGSRLSEADPATLQHDSYSAFLRAAAATPAVHSGSPLGLSDLAITAVLAHLAQDVPLPAALRLPPDLMPMDVATALLDLLPVQDDAHHAADRDATPLWDETLLDAVLERLRMLTADDMHFLHTLACQSLNAADMADLRALTELLDLPPLQHLLLDDILTFLPALAETPVDPISQTYTIDGVSGLARHGSLDMVLPTEWALPDTLLIYRFLNRELLYYGRERPPEQEETLFLLLLQASDAMAGDADVLARACTLALGRAAALHHATVQLCWFDQRLHPPQGVLSPHDIAALVQHEQHGPVDLPAVLAAVQQYVQANAADYGRIELLWLLHVDSGSDQVEQVQRLSWWLRNQTSSRALFVCAGPAPDQTPALASVLTGEWQVLGSALLHDAEARARAAAALRGLARSGERETLTLQTPLMRRRQYTTATNVRQRRTNGVQLIRTLYGHTSEVLGVAWSPDGQQLASASHDRSIKLWQVANGTCLTTITGHSQKVFWVAWSPDGLTLASASDDRTIRIWHSADGSPAGDAAWASAGGAPYRLVTRWAHPGFGLGR
ncbi:MAG: hypothetical protein HC837_15460 [Chloroflexaceae bacterium]|nr:hypothetical protein [Chloroflexaceae bacterium]